MKMFWLNLKRVLKAGSINFRRGGVVSLSAILVMIITLTILASVVLSSALLDHTLVNLRDKVDVNLSIVPGTMENETLKLKSELESLPEVESVEYMSDIQVLENYRERHKDDQKILAGLDELNENPLGAALNIKAKTPSQYESIQLFLNQNYPEGDMGSIVLDANYARKKEAIDKLSSIIDTAEKFGAIITIAFIILSILITLNTIRLAMYISRDEIRVMNLVGAEHSYISGPFIVTGAIYGIISSIIVLIILYPITYYLGASTSRLFFDLNIFTYYLSNFGQMFGIILLSGIVLGSFSSLLAVGRYLKR